MNTRLLQIELCGLMAAGSRSLGTTKHRPSIFNPQPAAMFGEGIIQGMAETARNFVGSSVSKDRLVTVRYPRSASPLKEATRQFPFLVYDGDDWQQGMRSSRARFARRNARRSASTSRRARTRSPISGEAAVVSSRL